MVVVKKKTEDYKTCFRQLNNMMIKDDFPVSVTEDVLQKLQKAKFFSIMYLENGFFSCSDRRSKQKIYSVRY